MREPTPLAIAFAWHRQALEDVANRLQVSVNPAPECGWFKCRLCRGGPFVPARIWLFQEIDADTGELLADELLQCEVNGECRDADAEWQWLCGNPITEAEFNYKTALRRHCAWHAPNDPSVNPRQKIDWLRVPTPRFT